MSKVIFHIDMNCFFASCEIAKDPSLAGKKIAVAHKSLDNRGLIVTASYEAKVMGVKTTMLVFEAKRICPDIIIVEPHYEYYEYYSMLFFDYLKNKVSKKVEPASIDEGYVDVTGIVDNNGYEALAKRIQDDLLKLYHLPCSIGIGPNKFLAKMASDIKKPLGITILRKKDIEKKMWVLPINDLFGCGKKTCALLNEVGIKTIGDFVHFKDQTILEKLLGSNGYQYLISSCYGNGSDYVNYDNHQKQSSISRAHTFEKDIYDVETIIRTMKYLSNNISKNLVEMQSVAYTFSLTIKYNNFKNTSKSTSISNPTNNSVNIYQIYRELFDSLYNSELAVRLISVYASKLEDSSKAFKQLTIFDSFEDEEIDNSINKVLKEINDLYGKETIRKGLKD